MISKKEKSAIKDLKNYLSKNYQLTDFRIFGSKIRGEDTPESDLDIMAVFDYFDPIMEANIDSKLFKINLEYDCLISLLIYGRNELQDGPLSESPLYKKVMKEGIPI